MTDRKAFEAWFEGYCLPGESDWFKRDPTDPEDYDFTPTQHAWDGWQAAIKQEREACAKVCEDRAGSASMFGSLADAQSQNYAVRACAKAIRARSPRIE